MPRFRNPIKNKYIEITDEEEEQMRTLVAEQGIFHHEAYDILKNQREDKLKNTLLSY